MPLKVMLENQSSNLGRGAFGNVFKSKLPTMFGSIDVAVKKFNRINDGTLEIQIMKSLRNHKNVVQFFHSFYDINGNIYFVMDLMEKSLVDLISNNRWNLVTYFLFLR